MKPALRNLQARLPHALLRSLAVFAAVFGAVFAADLAVAGDDSWLLSRLGDGELLQLVAGLDAMSTPRIAAESDAADAVCLIHDRVLKLERNRYRITDNAVYRVKNAERSDVATVHFQFPARCRVEEAAAWVLRDGVVIRCAKEQVKLVKGGDGKPTEVILAIPDVRDGDVVGWSVQRSENRVHAGLTLTLSERFPLKLARIRLLTDGYVAYRILGRNLLPGSFSVDILERRNGTETHTLAEVHDLATAVDGPFAPPVWSNAPTVDISWRGYLDTSIGQWLFQASWSEAAVWFESQLQDLTQRDRALETKARELVGGKESSRDRLEALHDFVRTEVVTVWGDEMRAEDRPSSEVLATRTASPLESGALLYAMADALGLNVRAVFARSLDLGPIDNGNPSLQQFTDLLVEDLDDPGRYYAPARRECAAGTLPDDLLGATALVLASDLAAKDREVIEDVFSSVEGKVGHLIAVYQDRVARLPWQTMFPLPGNPSAVRGILNETMRASAGCDTVRLELVVRGQGHLSLGDAAAGDPERILTDYCRDAFPAATVIDAGTGPGEGALTGTVELDPGQAAGDLWQIPTESIFGKPFLAGWETTATQAFHIGVTRESKRVCRIRVPDGWRLATVPPVLTVTHPRFTVTARMGIIDGELLVVREIRFVRGTTPPSDLPVLAAAVSQVRDFELVPILLVKTAAVDKAR